MMLLHASSDLSNGATTTTTTPGGVGFGARSGLARCGEIRSCGVVRTISSNNNSNTIPMTDKELRQLESVINERDKQILQQSDETFQPFSWSQAKDIVKRHALHELSRKPTDLRNYTLWKKNTVAKYGSIHNYLVNERLGWGGAYNKPYDPVLFGDPRDVIILKNDFPYGFDKSIHHLVVWTRAPIPLIKDLSAKSIEANGGDMPPESIEKIVNYIDDVFVQKAGIPSHEIVWFKNWASLQSVREIVHFHVLIHNPPSGSIDKVVGTSGLE